MVDISELKRLKSKGLVQPLEYARRPGGRLSGAIVSLLQSDALTVSQIVEKLKEKGQVYRPNAVYNACRRLEKKEKLVALNSPTGTLYFDRKRAVQEGLV